MLHIEALYAGYGGGTALHGVDMDVAAGAVHALVGVNGAGKTTLLHSIAGLLRPAGGRILYDGRDVTGLATHRRTRAGVALVPQGRRVFATLTVAEHLAISTRTPTTATGPGWDRDAVLDLFPQLAARLHHRGSQLSGGEQQMLAIARALLTGPRVLLADEPTEGLAPTLAGQVRDLLRPVAAAGTAVLLATPAPDLAEVADRVTILTAGRTTTGTDHAGHLDRDRLRAALTPGADGAPTAAPPASAAADRAPAWAGLLDPPTPAHIPTAPSTGDTHD